MAAELTGNAALVANWKRIEDPKEALRAILKHEDFLGYDPYFGDLRRELLEMAKRCSAESRDA